MAAVSPIRERIGKYWPILVLFLMAVFFLAQFDISMFERISTYCDVRKVMAKPGSEEEALYLNRSRDNAGPAESSRGDVQKPDNRPLPYAVATALLHYATTSRTPQQTHAEITVTLNILNRRGPCNFLVYGLGYDSPLWQGLNYGGRTFFLEEDPKWIAEVKKAHPSLEAHHVNYSTMLSQADDLLAYTRGNKEICSPRDDLLLSNCKLAIKTFPPHVYSMEWDVIMIDVPRGYFAEAPGRMSAIYSSVVMAMAKKRTESTDILLHDVERHVEKTWGKEFLCEKNLLESVGKLWHFQVYGEGAARTHFCVA